MSLTFNLILLSLLFAHGISLDCEVRRDRVLYEDQSHSIAYRCVPQDAPDEVYDIPFQIVQQLQRHFERSHEPTGTYLSIPGARVPIVPKTITSKSRLYDGSLNTVPTDTLSHELIVPENVQIVINNQRQHRQLAPKKQGELSILVVRAIASDAQTTLSEEILFERIFSDTSRSLSSVYNACSSRWYELELTKGAIVVNRRKCPQCITEDSLKENLLGKSCLGIRGNGSNHQDRRYSLFFGLYWLDHRCMSPTCFTNMAPASGTDGSGNMVSAVGCQCRCNWSKY